MPENLDEQIHRRFYDKYYDAFEINDMTVAEAARELESLKNEAARKVTILNIVRNDVSTHAGLPHEKFTRWKHSHLYSSGQFT